MANAHTFESFNLTSMHRYYTDYYRRTILLHNKGLKLVLGGTGLGKTSSLDDLLRSKDYPEDTKFIYVANRIQLLDEMAEQINDLNIHIQQRQNVDHLREAVANGALDEFLNHSTTHLLITDFNQRNGTFAIRLDTLIHKVAQFKRLQRFTDAELSGLIDISDHTWQLVDPLKQLLAFAKRVSEQAPVPGQTLTQKQATDLASLRVWPILFPYIRFQTASNIRLLLVTVQKAFRGVFDGARTMRLGNWDSPPLGRYVFIFDEFDFLENDLLKMLSDDREVSDPFGCYFSLK